MQLILSFEEVAGATDEESAFVLKRITSRFLSRMQDRNDRPREDFPVYWWAGPKAHVALGMTYSIAMLGH